MCKFVDILMEAQYLEMYERMKNKQNEAYNKYGKIKMILNLEIEENK